MKKLGLLSLAASLALTSAMAGNVELVSDLKIYGDADVRGISVKGDTDTVKKDKQVIDSKIRVNLDFTTLENVVVHTRIELKNDA